MTDPYTIIGAPRNATDKELKRAYRTQMNRYHPDKLVRLSESAIKMGKEKAQKVQAAYEQIKAERKPHAQAAPSADAPIDDIASIYNEIARGYNNYIETSAKIDEQISRAKTTLRMQFTGASGAFKHRFYNKNNRDNAEKFLRTLTIESKEGLDFLLLDEHLDILSRNIEHAQNHPIKNARIRASARATYDLYEKLILPRNAAIKNGLDVLSGRTKDFTYSFS